MDTSGSAIVLCFGVVLLVRHAMAIGGFEMELLLSKMDYLQDKLQEVEQTMKATIERIDSKFETRINAVENSLQNTIKEVEQTLKTSMQQTVERSIMAIENTLKKGLETIEIKARGGFEDLKNQFNFNMSHIREHQIAQIKSYQETSDFELKKISENKNALDTLSNSVRNISSLSEKSNKILEARFLNPVRSCRHVMKHSGKYTIITDENIFEVFCEQTKFEGGWTVIQQRYDGSVDFYRNWTEYRNGFGTLDGEFWLGLEYVHQMTKNRPHELLVEIKDFHGNYAYSKYEEFEIGSESEMYVLKKLGTYSGTAGDALQRHLNQKFSTFDSDNALRCAKDRQGAWWYKNCASSNLNGRYQNTTDDMSAITWYHFKNDWRRMSYSRMMIRSIIN